VVDVSAFSELFVAAPLGSKCGHCDRDVSVSYNINAPGEGMDYEIMLSWALSVSLP
jgi:hypothetical protein